MDFKADYATKVMMTNNDDTMDDTFIYIGSALIVACELFAILYGSSTLWEERKLTFTSLILRMTLGI